MRACLSGVLTVLSGVLIAGPVSVQTYDKPDCRPIWFGGRSRSTDAGLSGDYCVWLDIRHADGSWTWAVRADFSRGTHGWERAERIYMPAKPVSRIECFAFLRKSSGRAWFEDVFLRRELPEEGHVLASRRFTARPWKDRDRVEQRCLRKGRETPVCKLEPSASPFRPVCTNTVVWTADSMRRVYPLDAPPAVSEEARRVELELARGEAESAQICVSTPTNLPPAAVSLRVEGPFPGTVKIERIGYLARRDGYAQHPLGRADDELWFPEPLLPSATLTTVPGGTTGAWLTFTAARDAAPGIYAGQVVAEVAGRSVTIPWRVRVRGFALPERFGLKTAYSVMDGFLRATYPESFAARKREAWDLMLDHRLNPDDISRTSPPDLEDLEYAAKRGMNSFNVLNLVPPPKDPRTKWVCWADPESVFGEACYDHFRRTLTPYLAELKRRGLDRFAYLYGFDERGAAYYERLLPLWKRLKADFGLPVMTTAYMFRDVTQKKLDVASPLATMTDIHVPLESVYDRALADTYRAQGREVWWYTCCGPTYPHCNNASYEYPLVECRLLGWLQHQTRADGFLFWHVNFWSKGTLDETATFFPEWNTYSSLRMPGDGVFLYPGRNRVLGGIRLANVRDGVEDCEWLQLAEAKAGRAAVERILADVARSTSDFTRDPAVIRRARTRLADLVESP